MQYECENCEAPLTTGWLVCPQCGEKFDSPVPEYVDTVTPSETVPPVRYDLAGNELPPSPTVSLAPVATSVPTVSPVPIASPKIPIYQEREWMPQAALVKPKFYKEWTFLPNGPLKIGAVVGLILMIWVFNTWQHRRYVASERNYEQNGAPAAVASPVPPPPAQTTPQAPTMPAPLILMPAPKPRNDSFTSSGANSRAHNQPGLPMDIPSNSVTPRDDVPLPQSALQTALTAAAEAEQNGVTGVWSGAEDTPKTTNYNATISNSPALNTMLNAMDQMAQTQGVTSDLVDLRGRFLNILAKAYGMSADDLIAGGVSYMQFQNSHPGLSSGG